MGLFNRSNDSAAQELREARADLNERFNHRDADPDSPEYLAAHDRLVAAEKSAGR